jgi:hypothetical protein
MEFGIDAITIRRLIEHLAAIARSTADGLGPLTPDSIVDAFRQVCGMSPDDKGMVLIQRLPGLGNPQNEDGARMFIDEDFAEAAFSGAVFDYVCNPYTSKLQPENWQSVIKPFGAEMVAYRCHQENIQVGQVISAMKHSQKHERYDTLTAGLLFVLNHLEHRFNETVIYIKGVLVEDFVIDNPESDFQSIEFQDCAISHLDVCYALHEKNWPKFRRCFFAVVDGRTGENDLPRNRFFDCSFDQFEETTKTTQAILSLSMPLSTKVLLTILKKLYAQSGSGRKESALFRGLDPRAQQFVPIILNLLRREGFASKVQQGEDLWLPVRNGEIRRRALRILASPMSSKDPLLLQTKDVS